MTGKEQITLNANAAALAVMDEKIDRLIDRVEPVIDFYDAAASLLRWTKWILGLGASAAAIILALHALGILQS